MERSPSLFATVTTVALTSLVVLVQDARAEVVSVSRGQAQPVPALATTSASKPMSASRVRRLFPDRIPGALNNRVFTRPVCHKEVGGVRFWWPETGGGVLFTDSDGLCTTVPAIVKAAVEAATASTRKSRKLGFGSVRGDKRGRGRLQNIVATPRGPKRLRTPWPAGGSRAADVLVDPVATGQTVPDARGEMYCNEYMNRWASVFGRVRVQPTADPAIVSSVTAHELFHAVQCTNPRMGMTARQGRYFIGVHDAASEGTATWFQYKVYPENATGPIVVQGSGEDSWLIKEFQSGVAPWTTCIEYDPGTYMVGESASLSGYSTASIWLAVLKSRPAARLFSAWKRVKSRLLANYVNREALEWMIGRRTVTKALREVYYKTCRDRVVPGNETPIPGRSFNLDMIRVFGSSTEETQEEKLRPYSIASVRLIAFTMAAVPPWIDPGDPIAKRMLITVTGTPVATAITPRESTPITPGQPVEIGVPESGTLYISLFNPSHKRATALVKTQPLNFAWNWAKPSE